MRTVAHCPRHRSCFDSRTFSSATGVNLSCSDDRRIYERTPGLEVVDRVVHGQAYKHARMQSKCLGTVEKRNERDNFCRQPKEISALPCSSSNSVRHELFSHAGCAPPHALFAVAVRSCFCLSSVRGCCATSFLCVHRKKTEADDPFGYGRITCEEPRDEKDLVRDPRFFFCHTTVPGNRRQARKKNLSPGQSKPSADGLYRLRRRRLLRLRPTQRMQPECEWQGRQAKEKISSLAGLHRQ